jgi:hypothetical protein
MARCTPLLASLVLLLPATLHGQTAELPEGWQIRADRPGQDLSQVSFVDMPPGWHVTTGPAVILWNPATRASGDFRVEMEVFLFDPEGRREAFGVFVGGADLAGDGQRYTYFLVRDGGEFILKQREGGEAPTLVPWTAHEAIRGFAQRAEGDSSVRNVLAVEADGDEVRFSVNGREVASLPREGLALDGVVGLRVNHRLNLHVSRLEVTSSN